jgi:hypothetical protein
LSVDDSRSLCKQLQAVCGTSSYRLSYLVCMRQGICQQNGVVSAFNLIVSRPLAVGLSACRNVRTGISVVLIYERGINNGIEKETFLSINLYDVGKYSLCLQSNLYSSNICGDSGVPRNFIRGGGIQQIQLRPERTGIWGQWPPSQGFWRQL